MPIAISREVSLTWDVTSGSACAVAYSVTRAPRNGNNVLGWST